MPRLRFGLGNETPVPTKPCAFNVIHGGVFVYSSFHFYLFLLVVIQQVLDFSGNR